MTKKRFAGVLDIKRDQLEGAAKKLKRKEEPNHPEDKEKLESFYRLEAYPYVRHFYDTVFGKLSESDQQGQREFKRFCHNLESGKSPPLYRRPVVFALIQHKVPIDQIHKLLNVSQRTIKRDIEELRKQRKKEWVKWHMDPVRYWLDTLDRGYPSF